MTAVPDLLPALVLALGTFRLSRLAGWDDFPPVARLRDRFLGTTVDRSMTQRQEQKVFRYRRATWAAALHCPYCFAFWVGLAAYGFWLLAPTATLVVLFPFALNAVVGIVARNLD